MFDSELDVDVYDMLTSFPIESLSETFTEYLGVDVLFQTPFLLDLTGVLLPGLGRSYLMLINPFY